MTDLRVVDVGTVGALRSQALWHGIASAIEPDAGPTLSLCRPSEAYVSIGYHRSIEEIDREFCRAEGLPVLRRRIGGGPVLIDSDQLFFGLTLPVGKAPAGVDRLYATLLEPAAAAFRALGLEARIDGMNDIVVGRRKVSGTGAGQLADGVVVVGNVILRFDHARMARVLDLPGSAMRAECLRMMRRHVSSLEDEGLGAVSAADATAALRDSYAAALGMTIVDEALTEREEAAVRRWEDRLADEAWTLGRAHAPDFRLGRRVKVRADVFVVHGEREDVRVMATVDGDSIERASVGCARLNGTAGALERALVGPCADARALAARLADFGDDGQHVLAAVVSGLEARC
ncbi:MAG: lipoate---protein ligase [Solirubrobacteraceae bacterium]|nr:lipoate---protein ligase [Solirubrobacteraceae bacterium]